MAYKKIVESMRLKDTTPIKKPTICIKKSDIKSGYSNGIYFTFKAVDELKLKAGMLFAVEVDRTSKKIKLKRVRTITKPDLKYIRLSKHGAELSPKGNCRLYAVMGQLFKTLKITADRTIRKELKIINRNEIIFSYDIRKV